MNNLLLINTNKKMHSYLCIGWNCNPRFFIKRKFGKTNREGYCSGPFDLCMTSKESLEKCLESNFDTFFEGLSTIYGINAEGNRSKCTGEGLENITNKAGVIFNHEGSTHSHLFHEGKFDDQYYIRGDFFKFKERYTRRIANFKSYLENSTYITLVGTDQERCEIALKILQPRYINTHIDYLVI